MAVVAVRDAIAVVIAPAAVAEAIVISVVPALAVRTAERFAFTGIVPAMPTVAVIPIAIAVSKTNVAGVEAEVEALRGRRSRAADRAHRQGGREHRRCCKFLHDVTPFATSRVPNVFTWR